MGRIGTITTKHGKSPCLDVKYHSSCKAKPESGMTFPIYVFISTLNIWPVRWDDLSIRIAPN